MGMLERSIERHAVRTAAERGWLTYKWTSPNQRGVPDRLFLKDGQIVMVEFKAPGKKPTKLQQQVHHDLNKHGFYVYVIDCRKDIDTLLAA